MTSTRRLVVGIGNEDRGDDAAGLAVVRAMRPRLDPAVEVRECVGDLTELLDLWQGARLAIVVDAVRSGRPAGTILRQEVGPGEAPPTVAPASTHTFSLAEAIGLAQVLERQPERWIVYGIEAADVGVGHAMDPRVAAAVPIVATQALTELTDPAGGTADA